jgi:hypothetical protein
MPTREWKGVWAKALTKEEKAAIAAICDQFVADTLKPRFLPVIRPTQFNYPIDIFGRWRGSKYSFVTRYRSGFPEDLGREFDAAFTRFDHVEEHIAETRFDVMWHRHTGQWFRLHAAVTLEEGLRLVATEELLWPP